jgi:hypothetical protein
MTVELIRANRLNDECIANISHKLRPPLIVSQKSAPILILEDHESSLQTLSGMSSVIISIPC